MIKDILITKIFPITIAIVIGFLLYSHLQSNKSNQASKLPEQENNISYKYDNYNTNFAVENIVSAITTDSTILLIGSSELGTTPTKLEARADLFFNNYQTNLSLVSLGHAGNQSFSIYSQLLALAKYIKDSKISIIISPGWFTNQYLSGTSLESFLEFNNEYFLSEIYYNNTNDSLKRYLFKYIKTHFNDINSPLSIHSLMYDKSVMQNSILKKITQYPIYLFHKFPNSSGLSLNKKYNLDKNKKYDNQLSDKIKINNWDSLYQVAIDLHIANSTNNNWSINNTYYTKYVKGEVSHQKVDKLSKIKEFEDFKMLLYLLKYYHVDASFIIQPLNPYAYDNLKDLKPIISEIEKEIENFNYPYYNMFVYDTINFQDGILTDIMHLGEYGWFKIDNFLVNTYEKK